MKTSILALATVLAAGLLAGCGGNEHDRRHMNGDHHDHASGAERADVQGDPYPLDTCPVSGKKLGSMGDPVVHFHEGREIRFCCAACIEPFEENPARHLETLDAAMN